MAPTIITTTLVPAAAPSGGAVYDLVDLATVKDDLGITGGATDVFLKRTIVQISAEIALFCNRVFPVETLLDQVYPWRDTIPYVVIGGECPLQLTRWPVATPPCLAGLVAPVAPVLSAVAGGALAATRYFVMATYVTAAGETAASAEVALSVAANGLLEVAAPVPDSLGLATGWNVYVGTAAGKEIKQNTAPLALGAPWVEPTAGLSTVNTATPPAFVAVVENSIPLAEGVDFLVKYDVGQLVRLDTNLWPKRWPALPITVIYPTGFATIPADVQDGALRLIKIRYYGRTRDPMLRQENIAGVWEGSWWFASGPGASTGNMPPDVEAILEKYRVPVIG